MKILITGSSGTIGTRLFEKLVEEKYDVIGFDKKPNKWHKHLNKATIIGDLLSEKDIKKIPKDIDLIIHLAANARVYDLVVEPDLAFDNVASTYNILEFARKNNIKKILFSSSREVYGNRKEALTGEKEVDLELAESPYSASKISNEAFVYAYQRCYGIEYVILRFSNVYGMYDESNRFVPLVIGEMRHNKNVKIFGKNKILDFTYIDDCVLGIISAMEKFQKVKNDTFNVSYGKGYDLLEVANLIKELTGSKSKIVFKKNRSGEVVKYVGDIKKAKQQLGYKPAFSVREGIRRSVSWYNKPVA